MPTTPTSRAAPAAHLPFSAPAPAGRSCGAKLHRWAAAALLAACAGLARPAAAAEPARLRGAPARNGGALLLLSFLVPLPLPAALVAPPDATRAPASTVPACTGPQREQRCLAARQPDLRR